MIQDIKDHISERLSSPFFGPIAVAWVSVNYKLLLVLFAGGDYAEKIAYIDNKLYPDGLLYRVLWLPLLLAALYLLLAPSLRIGATAVAHWWSTAHRRVEAWLQNFPVMTVQEGRDQRRAHEKVTTSLESQIQNQQADIDQLKAEMRRRSESETSYAKPLLDEIYVALIQGCSDLEWAVPRDENSARHIDRHSPDWLRLVAKHGFPRSWLDYLLAEAKASRPIVDESPAALHASGANDVVRAIFVFSLMGLVVDTWLSQRRAFRIEPGAVQQLANFLRPPGLDASE